VGGALVLAQSGSGGAGQALVWVGVLIGVVLVASIVVLFLRRRLFAKDTAGADPGSILESMRALRDSGRMTPEEYDRARETLVRRARGDAAPRPAVKPANPAPEAPEAERRARPGFDLTGAPLPGSGSPPRSTDDLNGG